MRIAAFDVEYVRYTAVVGMKHWVHAKFRTRVEDGLAAMNILPCKNAIASGRMCMFSFPAVGPIHG